MILQKQIQTTKATILVIGGLKEPVYSLGIDNCILWFNGCGVGNAPAGEWERLGFLKDISEDVAKELVDDEYRYFPDKRQIFRNYLKPLTEESIPFTKRSWDIKRRWEQSWDDPFGLATESLHSLIEANCKLKNKYGEEPKLEEYHSIYHEDNVDDFNYEHTVWLKEQSQIFVNPYLLKKI